MGRGAGDVIFQVWDGGRTRADPEKIFAGREEAKFDLSI